MNRLRTPLAVAAQLLGMVCLLLGVFALFGLGWTLLVGGALTVALGALVEGKVI